MTKKYRSEPLAAVHETMEALHKVGGIDKQTMRRFDDARLRPVNPLTPKQIRALRVRERVSQTVFANYLNVTPNLVSQVGAGREETLRPGAQAPVSGKQARHHGGCL